jgi:hypothetical protein
VWKIQHGADAREPGYWLYLNPARVVALELPRRGLRAPFQIYPPVRVTVGYRHRLYTVLLSQPVEQGSKGIWVISGVTAQPVAGDEGEGAGAPERGSRYATRVVRLGPVRHTAMEINRIQEAVRRGDPAYAYYVNPVQVVVRQLPHFGFHGRLELRPELNVRVVEGTVNYDVELSQPARKGSAGIWLVSAIRLQSPEQEPPGGDGD